MYYFETKHGNSITPQNQRFVVIHSFFRYISPQNPEYIFISQYLCIIVKDFVRFGCNSIVVECFVEMDVPFIFTLPCACLEVNQTGHFSTKWLCRHKELFGYAGINDVISFSKVGP